jgi:hypothetical protein
MSLAEQMLDEKVEELKQDIDREVLWTMLKEIGWTRVMLSSETAMVNATAIKEWLEVNCKKSYEKHRQDFLFEDNKDAVNFILRWL